MIYGVLLALIGIVLILKAVVSHCSLKAALLVMFCGLLLYGYGIWQMVVETFKQ
jgi:hypothetical protein